MVTALPDGGLKKIGEQKRGIAWRRVILPWQCISGIWVEESCIWGGKGGEQSKLVGSVRLCPCYVVLPV